MGFIKRLVDKITHKNSAPVITMSKFKAMCREGVNVCVIDFYHEYNHLATLSIETPSVLGVTLEIFKDFNQKEELKSAIRRHYTNVEFVTSIQ